MILAKLHIIEATIPKKRDLKDKDDIKAILKYNKVNLKTLKEKVSKEKTTSILEELMNLKS